MVAKIRGQFVLVADRVELRATGTFGDQSIDVDLRGDGKVLRGGHVESGPRFELPQPREVRDALVIGMSRMGLLHNVARLIGGRPPDRAEGGVREWVVADDVAGTGEVVVKTVQDSAPTLSPLTFSLVVAGTDSGRATLWTDAQSGAPVERHQIVQFPEGEMRVLEVYTPMETL